MSRTAHLCVELRKGRSKRMVIMPALYHDFVEVVRALCGMGCEGQYMYKIRSERGNSFGSQVPLLFSLAFSPLLTLSFLVQLFVSLNVPPYVHGVSPFLFLSLSLVLFNLPCSLQCRCPQPLLSIFLPLFLALSLFFLFCHTQTAIPFVPLGCGKR